MTTVKPTQVLNMKHFKKTCVQASLIVSVFAAGASHAQLGSFEASIANMSSLLQVCAEAYPQQDLPIKAVLQDAVKAHFGEGPLGDVKYRQMLATLETKAYTTRAVLDLKQQQRQGKLNMQKACLAK